jgi:hypothetical protein
VKLPASNRLTLACAMLLAAPCAFALSFQPYQATPLGGDPVSVAVGDITGDGLDDVVLTTRFTDYLLYVFVQMPDGTLAAPQTVGFRSDPRFDSASTVALGDWNGDGIKDIVVGQVAGVTVFLGGKSLVPVFYHSLFSNGEKVAMADVNRDGALDIISQGGGRLWTSIYEGNGSGGIRRMVYAQPRGGHDMKIADLNHDGYVDIAGVARTGTASVLNILYNSAVTDPRPIQTNPRRGAPTVGELPDPRYTTLPMQFYPGYFPAGLGVGDFNHDGWTDVAMSDAQNSPRGAITISLQQPNGQPGAPLRMTSYDLPGTLLGTDLDGDGRDDLLVLHDGWESIGYYLQGDSGLQEEVLLPLPFGNDYPRQGLAVGDINHDGRRDIVLVSDVAGLVVLLAAP